jgi:hypothetical protein
MTPSYPRGVETNGIGRKCKSHLNLTVTMAGASIRDRRSKRRTNALMTAEERRQMILDGLAKKLEWEARRPQRVKFAGFDPHEIRLQLQRAE